MIKKLISLLFISIFLFTGCFTITHQVNNGAQGNDTMTERQWYVLFGLVPINEVNTKTMAGDATDYTIKTEMTFVDGVIGIFTGLVSVVPRSVSVTK